MIAQYSYAHISIGITAGLVFAYIIGAILSFVHGILDLTSDWGGGTDLE